MFKNKTLLITGDIYHSNADISKAKRVVGYAPTHDIYQGMEEAIEWYNWKQIIYA